MGKKFLIVQLACYGDCLFATSIARQIKQDHPDSHITWAVASRYRNILDLNPDIDKIWEVDIPGNDFYKAGWDNFEATARAKKAAGEFDEIIFSQIDPLNWDTYKGTIRGTILSAYGKPISVSRDPVVVLSEKEIAHVAAFAQKNKLPDFDQVVLFECAPGSGQSKLTPAFALSLAQKFTAKNSRVCFILSTPDKLAVENAQIIDASELSFRENAALTHYCSLLIGCSSGITWLSTSTAAKKLPMIQLLQQKGAIFAGVHFDFEVNGIDNPPVLEMVEYDEANVLQVLTDVFGQGMQPAKLVHHQHYFPGYYYLKKHIRILISKRRSSKLIFNMIKGYKAAVGDFPINYIDHYYQVYVFQGFLNPLKKLFKSFFKKKQVS
ncbi:MAG: hypothetical protein WBO30_13570 [Ferruginibacter sp.]